MSYVDVVIPVHNNVHWLSWCLEELFRFNSARLGKVFVVNDRCEYSQSKRIIEIVGRYQNVELIPNSGEKGGLVCARNLGARSCSAEVILFLNADCLLTEGLLDRLCTIFECDQSIALACPVSNNSQGLTHPMLPGHSYRDMARYCADATSHAEKDFIVEACTVVGDCLMVHRAFFEKAGGFSVELCADWKDADLHMKALSLGLKGVVHVGCYCYRFARGAFNCQPEVEHLRSHNHRLFMSKWSKEYKRLAARCSNTNPSRLISKAIKRSMLGKSETIELDALFYLHGIDQGVGGINAVVSICNELVRMGLKVTCALVGITADRGLKDYKEPVLFNFLHYISDSEFLTDRLVLPKVVFSTIFNSAPVVAEFAAARKAIAVQFVQGYEGYFENGQRYVEATDSYKSTEHLITTSTWLFNMLNRHVKPDQNLQRVPLVINNDIYFSSDENRDIDVCMIFRASADKGQWLLAELLDRLAGDNMVIAVLCASPYENLEAKYLGKLKFFNLPLDQYSLAQLFRRSKVFVDMSLHEGFGLMPLEAALCGCSLVVSDSGGVRDFVNYYEGELVVSGPDPKNFIDAIGRQLEKFNSTRQVKAMPAHLRMGGGSWYQYIQGISHNMQTPVSLPDFVKEKTVLNKFGPSPCHRVIFYGGMAKIYRRVFPYIPKRLHLALKVIIFGKI